MSRRTAEPGRNAPRGAPAGPARRGAGIVGALAGLALFAHATRPDSHTYPFVWVALGGALVAWSATRRGRAALTVGRAARLGAATGAVAALVALGMLGAVASAAARLPLRAIGLQNAGAQGLTSTPKLLAFAAVGVLAGTIGGAAAGLIARGARRTDP